MNDLFPPSIHIPSKVICQKGGLFGLAAELKEYGAKGIIVHGPSFEKSGIKEKLFGNLSSAGLKPEFFCRGNGEASLSEIDTVIKQGRKSKALWITGIGGGSVLDLAKAAAGLFNAVEKPVYYQEGGSLTEKGIPFVAVPTTAGSGSEATSNAVIINPDKKLKLSIRHKSFLAEKVILDIELLKNAPRTVKIHSGMDALLQAYESFISRNATEFTDGLALRAVEMISSHIVPAVEKNDDESLHAMLVGSFFAGIAFSHSRLGVVHGIAHPLGVLYDVPHGLVCAACFIPSLKLNRKAMGDKYPRLTRAVKMDFTKKIEHLLRAFGIKSPFKGNPVAEEEKIIAETLNSGSTAANPKPITYEDVKFILKEIF